MFLIAALALPAAAAPSPAPANRVEYRCDPRIDLLGVVQSLAGRRKSEPRLPNSMRGLRRRFAAYRGHPAVRTYESVARRLNGDEPYVLALSALGPPPALVWELPLEELSVDFVEMAGGPEALRSFVEELRDFAARSGVMDWLSARAQECRSAESAAARETAGRDALSMIEDYVGLHFNARGLMPLSLIYTPSHYDSYILPYPYSGTGEPPKGPFLVYSLLSPEWDRNGLPRFGLDRPFVTEAFPEFYYLAVEPAYQRHRVAFEARAWLLESLKSECTSNWQNCVTRLLVQAINLRLISRHGEDVDPARAPVSETVLRLARVLESEYEPGRASGRYRSIEQFWPRLIDSLGPAR